MSDELFLKSPYDMSPELGIHTQDIPGQKARYAMSLAERMALVAAVEDGEDSSGRAKARLATPTEIAQRACAITSALFAEMDAYGWILRTDDWDTLVNRFEKHKKDSRAAKSKGQTLEPAK